MLEYNCRFGDPETQSVLPLVDGDLLAALAAAATRRRSSGVSLEPLERGAPSPSCSPRATTRRRRRGTPIEGIEAPEATGALVFHAGTALHDGRLVTNGGRLLGVTATGADARGGPGARLRRCRPDPDPGRTAAARTSRSAAAGSEG